MEFMDHVRRIIDRHRLTFAVMGVIGIALLMTTISMSLYITSGTSSLDLSRPGYSQIRDQLVNPAAESFNEIGPMNEKTVTDFRKIYDSQRSALNGLGDFKDTSLDDASLELQAQQ